MLATIVVVRLSKASSPLVSGLLAPLTDLIVVPAVTTPTTAEIATAATSDIHDSLWEAHARSDLRANHGHHFGYGSDRPQGTGSERRGAVGNSANYVAAVKASPPTSLTPMSEIRDMNRSIAINGSASTLVLTAAVLVAAQPGAVHAIVHHGLTSDSLWAVPAAIVMAVLTILEAVGVGRNTRHRGKVDGIIARDIVRRVCTNQACPNLPNPSSSTAKATRAVFYARIDAPSREVAFYDWGWYYTSILWVWQAGIAVIVALLAAAFAHTSHHAVRWLVILGIACWLLLTFYIARRWRAKTEAHTKSQLLQISGSVGIEAP